MTTETEVTRFVSSKDVVIPYKVLETASEEANDYKFMRLGNGHYVCAHGDNAYALVEKMSPDDVPVIGCSCPAWTFGHAQDGCKHVAAFQHHSTKPAAQVTSRIKLDLLAAGWRESKDGNLYPPSDEQKTAERQADVDAALDASRNKDYPGTTSDEPERPPKKPSVPNPVLGDTVHTLSCAHCDRLFEGTDPDAVKLEHRQHMGECERNPKNTKPKQEEPKMDEEVSRILTAAEALGAKDIDVDYIIEKLAKLKTFRVTGSEAERSVVSGILRTQGIKRPKGEGGHAANVLRTVESIDAPDVWCNIHVKVTQLWDSDKDSIRQIGLVGDETGVMKFVSWEKANLTMLEVDKCYLIENVVTNEYEGVFSVAFTKNTNIAAIEEDIEVGFTTSEFTGIMVAIQNGSGLIKRCPVCNRAMQKGICAEHGTVQGIPDMRIKAVLDNGIATKNILLNRERTEAVTGITMDAATAMAREALDADVVMDAMCDMLIAREYVASGYDMGDTLLVESVHEVAMTVAKEDMEEFLKEV